MPQIHTEQRNGLTLRYFNAAGDPGDERFEGRSMRVYLLPGVPMNAGEIPKMPNIPDLKEAVKGMFKPEHQEVAERIGTAYSGRQIDAISVLKYAEEQGKFGEFAKRLDDEMSKSITFVHPDLRYARTDITAFFLELYADLGIAPKKVAERDRKMVQEVGPGVVVLLRE